MFLVQFACLTVKMSVNLLLINLILLLGSFAVYLANSVDQFDGQGSSLGKLNNKSL